MQSLFSIHKSINVVQQCNKLEDIDNMNVSTDAEKTFDKLNIHLWKKLSKMGREGSYLNTIKVIYDEPTANSILSGENGNLFY